MAVTDPRPFPPGEYPVVVIGSGPGGLQLSYGLRHYGIPHAVLSADPAAGRHVPQVAVLPAAALVDEAVRARRSGAPASTSATTGTASSRSSRSSARCRPSSWTARRTSRRAPRCRRTWRRSPSGPASPSGTTAAGSRPRREDGPDGHDLRHPHDRRRLPREVPRARRRRRGAVEPEAARHRARPPLRGHARGVHVRRQADVHHRQAELRVRAGVGARGLGVVDHRVLAVAGQDVRSRSARSSASGPATCSRSRTASWVSA